ncbi:Antibiotic biosynthesis monooxygenase, partial [Dysosmobacter welbionis]
AERRAGVTWDGPPSGGHGGFCSRRGLVQRDAPPIVVVAKSAQLRFRLRRKLRLLPCSSSPHRAGRGGGPFRSCQKRNGPCTVQKKRPLRRAPARSCLRATGVGGSVQAPIL